MASADADESELEMVRRHVCQGADHVARQRAIVARFRAAGVSTDEAEALLALFLHTQKQHEAHLARIDGRGAIKPGNS